MCLCWDDSGVVFLTYRGEEKDMSQVVLQILYIEKTFLKVKALEPIGR